MNRLPQPMQPHGLAGRMFGKAMDLMNGRAHDAAMAEVIAHAPRDILEIGFGTGRFAVNLARAAPVVRIAGVDPSELMVATANARARRAGVADRVALRLGDSTCAGAEPESFDAVVAIHSFQFWAAPEESMARIYRLLRPAGRLLLVLRDHGGRSPDWLPNRISRSADEMYDTCVLLAAAGFTVAGRQSLGGSPSLVATKA